MKVKDDREGVISCLASMFTVLVTGPMWYVLMFGILSRIDAPTWLWALFWCYVPIGFASVFLVQIAKVIAK